MAENGYIVYIFINISSGR